MVLAHFLTCQIGGASNKNAIVPRSEFSCGAAVSFSSVMRKKNEGLEPKIGAVVELRLIVLSADKSADVTVCLIVEESFVTLYSTEH